MERNELYVQTTTTKRHQGAGDAIMVEIESDAAENIADDAQAFSPVVPALGVRIPSRGWRATRLPEYVSRATTQGVCVAWRGTGA